MLTKHLEQLASAASLSLGESLQSCQDLSLRVYPSPFTPSSGRWPWLGTRKCQRAGWEHGPPAGEPAAPAFCSLWSGPCQLACTLPTRPGLEGKQARLNQTRQGLPGHPRAGGRSTCCSLHSRLMRGVGSKGEKLWGGGDREVLPPIPLGGSKGKGRGVSTHTRGGHVSVQPGRRPVGPSRAVASPSLCPAESSRLS